MTDEILQLTDGGHFEIDVLQDAALASAVLERLDAANRKNSVGGGPSMTCEGIFHRGLKKKRECEDENKRKKKKERQDTSQARYKYK